MTAALRAQAVTVRLGGEDVVCGVSLAIPARRWTSIVGPNGAGKTTLLKALAHLLPYAGSVMHADVDAATLPARERARRIAWLGQNEEGAHDLLARDVVMLGRLPHQSWFGSPSPADRAAVERAMRETQCWDWRGRPLGELSGGERQRVLLARALAVEAPILLMDEPLANLDPPHQADWLATVQQHVGRGGTVVSVLHELTMALHADELVVLEAGRVVRQGPSADPAMHRSLEAVFGGRIAVRAIEGQWVALPVARP